MAKGEKVVRVHPVTVEVVASKVPDNKLPKNFRFTTTIVTHELPELLPFGNTVIRMDGNRWWVKCGQFRLHGYDGTVEDIAREFVNRVWVEVDETKKVTAETSFELTDKRAVNLAEGTEE